MSSLNPVLTVGRQITEALELHLGIHGKQARQRAIELLELVRISSARERLDAYPHHFSGGMRQRVMIAIALACEPKLLIADEPTTALDVTIQAQILDLMKDLQANLGMALILITHDLGVVAGVADRTHVMYAGYIVEAASAVKVFRESRHPYTVGLKRSIPRIDQPRVSRLTPIQGAPPDLSKPIVGCPFAPRCRYAVDQSYCENPQLRTVGEEHYVACWVDIPPGGDGE